MSANFILPITRGLSRKTKARSRRHVQLAADGLPVVKAWMKYPGPGSNVFCVRCPYCGSIHTHGLGGEETPCRTHRLADCAGGAYWADVRGGK